MRISRLLISAAALGLTLMAGPVSAARQESGLSAPSAGGSALVDAALDLVRGGSYEMGFEELRRLGEEGYPDAFFHLGEIHRLGIGRDTSVPIATMYYRLAAGLGHRRAALSLANILFFESDGSDASLNEAMAVWQQYALMEDPEAMYMLGMIYWNGEGGRLPDPIRGYGLVWKAAAEGYADAINSESAMTEQLSEEARTRGRQYASALEREGFGDQPIALYMVMGRKADAAPLPEGTDITADAPVSRVSLADPATDPVTGPVAETPAPAREIAEAAAPADEPAHQAMEDLSGMPDYAAADDDGADAPVPEFAPDEPVDWSRVWHLEVGYAMSQEEVTKLQKVIMSTQGEAIGDLRSEVTESMNRPGLYRLVFGPLKGMRPAVRRCVALKRAGYDCFAKPPQ